MKMFLVKNYEELSRKAAGILAAQVISKPNSILGLATGSTPLGTYANLVEWCKNGDVDFSNVTTFNLDEYAGLSEENDQSYRYFMNTNLFDQINIDKAKTHVPNGKAADLTAEGLQYDQMIREHGGIDIQLLGIGHSGHIGFNEPDDVFVGSTHPVTLVEQTIQANARFFGSIDKVPTMAITMGMTSIMQAKKVLLIANGQDKKEIVEKAFYGPITPKVPASILQLHPDCTVICSW